jgi:hypothetical protein
MRIPSSIQCCSDSVARPPNETAPRWAEGPLHVMPRLLHGHDGNVQSHG